MPCLWMNCTPSDICLMYWMHSRSVSSKSSSMMRSNSSPPDTLQGHKAHSEHRTTGPRLAGGPARGWPGKGQGGWAGKPGVGGAGHFCGFLSSGPLPCYAGPRFYCAKRASGFLLGGTLLVTTKLLGDSGKPLGDHELRDSDIISLQKGNHQAASFPGRLQMCKGSLVLITQLRLSGTEN